MAANERFRVPQGLGEAGERLWREVSAGLTFRPDELAILEAAARVADQAAALAEVIAEGEPMIAGSQGQRVLHPAIPELRQQRQLVASLLSRLDIPDDHGVGGEWDNLTASQRARRAARSRWDRAA